PAQKSFSLLVELLHQIPPVSILHHRLQGRVRTKVAPVVASLAVAAILPDQPPDPSSPLRSDSPAPHSHRLDPQPTFAALPPADRPPLSSATGGDQRIHSLRGRE